MALLSLLDLCAREVVRDHSSSPCWLRCVPRELYGALLHAAFASCRPLAVGELVQRWPERRLRVCDPEKPGQQPPNRLCVQALLLAVVRGLSNQRCALMMLDLCGLQRDEGGDPMGGWSLTVALCTMVVQAKAAAQRAARREVERERKRLLAMEREKDVVKKERVRERETEGEERLLGDGRGLRGVSGTGAAETPSEEEQVKGVRRRMELERRERAAEGVAGGGRSSEEPEAAGEVVMHVRADLFVNARSWDRVRAALSARGPLALRCRYLRVEELSVACIGRLLELLLPARGLLGVDVRYSSLGMEGLAALLPRLASFPALSSLRLHYCNLELRWRRPGGRSLEEWVLEGGLLGEPVPEEQVLGEQAQKERVLGEVSLGLSRLQALRCLSLTALRLPGHLRLLLSSLSRPLEVLELPYLALSPADLAFLSCSLHTSSLRQLDLSENHLVEVMLPSLQRLLSRTAGTLEHLALSGCGLGDALLRALLPSLGRCRALRGLALALNPLSMAALEELVRSAAGMPSLRQLLYPNALEEYQPGLPDAPSSSQLLDWPLDELQEANATSNRLQRLVREKGRSDLVLTCDLLNYHKDLLD